MTIPKLPEAVQKQVAERMAVLLTGEVEAIAVMVFEIGYRTGVKDVKERIAKHCTERAVWLESQRVARPTEDWGVKKVEVEHLALELRAFSEEPVA